MAGLPGSPGGQAEWCRQGASWDRPHHQGALFVSGRPDSTLMWSESGVQNPGGMHQDRAGEAGWGTGLEIDLASRSQPFLWTHMITS